MKSCIYTIVSAFLLSLLPMQQAHPCGGPWYTPRDYYTFRIYNPENDRELCIEDEYGRLKLKSESRLNCELWQKQTAAEIPVEDIYKAVYKSTYEDIARIPQLIAQPNAKDSLMQNQFVKWIVSHKDREVAEFLLLAKLCEKIRWEQSSPWYYPTDNDHVSLTLTDVAAQAQAYGGKRLQDRYALQAIRALFATAQYDKCINYWNDMQNKLPDNLLKKMIWPYVAGAYFRTGAIEKAKQIYAECGDVSSLLYCAGKQGKQTSEIEQMELVYKYCPNSPMLASTTQQLIRFIEEMSDGWGEPSDGWWASLLPLSEFALKAISEGKTANPAMWYYTAAYIADKNGKVQQASDLLTKAEHARGDKFTKESIKILRIYLDAKLLPCNAAYEQTLFGQLRWLDKKIIDNIDERVVKETADGYYLNANISYYYWNDMLRKIVLSTIVPKYIAHGNCVRAIQLANLADNRLYNLVDKQTYSCCIIDSTRTGTMAEYRKNASWNSSDYSNSLFMLVDTIGVDNVIAYTKRLKHPQTAFDDFLNTRGYVSLDYFNDIIGTQCLREMRYAEAVAYLGKVPSAFQYTLNTYRGGYMKRDPFNVDSQVLIYDNSDYKFNFAREMLSLERIANQTTDPNRKAQMLIRYAVGIRNSMDRCWALTQYYRGTSYWSVVNDWTETACCKKARSRSDILLKDAFAMFTDDECAAHAHHQLCHYHTVVEKYPDTATAKIIRGACDNYRDYRPSKK
ncbi:hypothetical protein [Alistipes sp. i18-0019-D1]|jgi:hypothetical protein|uniref:hypothetical protein n=1 Tax=Alistipes sp. i18-0019-D1 TaxID=3132707 RepID=UPI0036F39E25